MAGRPDGGTLPGLAHSRVVGKPFTCTEYNHPAPNTYSSEAFLLRAAFAARQDWDGIFAFAYSHRGDQWDTGSFGSFFDIDQHPTKMVALPAAAAMFLRGDVPPAGETAYARPTAEEYAEAMRRAGPFVDGMAFGVAREAAFHRRDGQVLPGTKPTEPARPKGGSFALRWLDPALHGEVRVDSPRSRAVIGPTAAGSFDLGTVTVEIGPNRQGWAAITLTAIDGPNFASPGRLLITATGYAENTGMTWKDESRSSVERNWGSRPSLVEGIPAEAVLRAVEGGVVRAWALDERGQRLKELPVLLHGNQESARIRLDPDARTPWYEAEIGR